MGMITLVIELSPKAIEGLNYIMDEDLDEDESTTIEWLIAAEMERRMPRA